MNREEKAELLSEMNGLISGSEAVVISHYRGLTVAEMGELRKKARELGAELRVTKNRITRLALKGTKFEGLDDLFKGPTIMAYSSDPISACKLCKMLQGNVIGEQPAPWDANQTIPVYDNFGGWNGGAGLGDENGNAFWGGYPDHEKVLNYIVSYNREKQERTAAKINAAKLAKNNSGR